MFELYQFWFDIEKSREKKLYAIKLLLNDKNKFFNSRILYISIFFLVHTIGSYASFIIVETIFSSKVERNNTQENSE